MRSASIGRGLQLYDGPRCRRVGRALLSLSTDFGQLSLAFVGVNPVACIGHPRLIPFV